MLRPRLGLEQLEMAGADELILRAKKAADNACIAAELASLRTAMNASFARTSAAARSALSDSRTDFGGLGRRRPTGGGCAARTGS